MLLELAHDAPRLFVGQPPDEQRQLLKFLVLNSTWKTGKLTVSWRQPFNIIADLATDRRKEGAASDPSETTPTGFKPVSPGCKPGDPPYRTPSTGSARGTSSSSVAP